MIMTENLHTDLFSNTYFSIVLKIAAFQIKVLGAMGSLAIVVAGIMIVIIVPFACMLW